MVTVVNTQTPSVNDAIGPDSLAMLQGKTAALLNAIDDGIYLLDASGNTVYINDAAARMLGFALEDLKVGPGVTDRNG